MKDREEEDHPHRRLKQLFSDLEQEWDAMKTAKKSSVSDSSITVAMDQALRFLVNSPRKLMLCLQQDRPTSPEPMESPFIRRKLLFDDSDKDNGESRVTSALCDDDDSRRIGPFPRVSNDSSWTSSNVLWVGVCFAVLLVLAVLMNGYDRSVTKQTITLVPT
ncbi:PREDICTED: uncharacterized protein LOC104825023 [Tarenaya hassleriana]|uniref:uncharacterized protein LOC104825023 n=1 Tax=Tarenaya hassleriana TaxID=28532 RepID=UPI00053C1C75|nr:PREDICTED: uncharacterized protein LOC104825023 [Tarenaya hassleriana]